MEPLSPPDEFGLVVAVELPPLPSELPPGPPLALPELPPLPPVVVASPPEESEFPPLPPAPP